MLFNTGLFSKTHNLSKIAFCLDTDFKIHGMSDEVSARYIHKIQSSADYDLFEFIKQQGFACLTSIVKDKPEQTLTFIGKGNVQLRCSLVQKTRESGVTGFIMVFVEMILDDGRITKYPNVDIDQEQWLWIKQKNSLSSGVFSTEYAHLDIAGQKVLIVDDDLLSSHALSETLKQFGLQVDCVSDFQSAKTKPLNDYDFIMIDYAIPDAKESLCLVKYIHYHCQKSIAMILISADNIDTQINDFFDKGIKGFIKKPVDQRHLMDLLQKEIVI